MKTIADISNTEISNLIDEWIHNDRNRALLKSRFIDGHTYEQLAFEYNLSTQRVKSIVYSETIRLNRKIC